MKMQRCAIAVVLFLVGCLVGCGSTGESGAGRTGTGSNGGASSSVRGSSSRSGSGTARAGTGKEFTAAQKARMDVAWTAWKNNSPGWPALRDDWIAMGPKAVATLTENLYGAMVISRLRHAPEWYENARKELMLLGELAVPTLAGTLANPTWLDPKTGNREPLPVENATETLEILVVIGKPAIPALSGLATSENAQTRRGAVEALGKIHDPAGLPAISAMLRSGDHWADRMTAARAAGYIRTSESETILVRALEDSDEAVVIEAARSLARLRSTRSLPALDRRAQRAQANRQGTIYSACTAAARVIRGGR